MVGGRVMGIDFFTLSKARRLVEKKVIEAGGMTPSSVEAIVKEKVGTEVNAYLTENPETEFLNIKKMGAVGDGETDDSACFAEGVPGYIVNDGVYCVDGATMEKLNEKNCIGNGYLKLLNPQQWGNDGTEKWYAPFDYTIAVKDLGNTLRKILVSTSEADYYSEVNRKNATAMLKPLEGTVSLRTIGAFYKVDGATLPDEFTLCIGKINLFLLTKDGIWKRVMSNSYPNGYGMWELPWVPETSRTLSSDKYVRYDDHIEFKLSPADFEGQADGKTESVLHFWGKNYRVDSADIVAIIGSYNFWVKEEEAKDMFICTIGVDQIDVATSTIKQGYSGIAMKVENYLRTQWGSTMNRELCDKYFDGKTIEYLNSLPTENKKETCSKTTSTTEYDGDIAIMPHGDIWQKIFSDTLSYRGYIVQNPIRKLFLPYNNYSSGNTSEKSTGLYLKLFSMPFTNKMTIKLDCTRATGTTIEYISAIVTFANGVNIKILNGENVNRTGIITVVVNSDSTSATVYIKGVAWTLMNVDMEILTYANVDVLNNMDFDMDLLRVGAGSYNVMTNKWIAVDTTDCTVIESGKTSALEDRIAELETQIASLTTTTTE